MNRLTRPLDPNAVQAANAAVAQQTGGRPLTMSREDAPLRRLWNEAYLAELSQKGPTESAKGDVSAPEESLPGEYQDTAGADNDPGQDCAVCQSKPGAIKVFFVHAFDDTPVPSLPVQLFHGGSVVDLTTDAEGMVSLEDVDPGYVQVKESNKRTDLPEKANRTKPNNRYFPGHTAIGWAQSTNGGMTRDAVLASGLVKSDTIVKSKQTTYIVLRKRKVYEAGLFAHVENKPADQLAINDVIGHTFVTCQVPGPKGRLGTFNHMAGAGYISSGTQMTYSNEIARGHWPEEGLGQKQLITGTDGKIADEELGGYFDADAREWEAGQGPPTFHAAHKHFDIDHATATKLLMHIAELENDPPDYVLARTFRGVATGRQTIADAVGQGDHCTTSAIGMLQHVGLSVPLTSFASPASVIEAINGTDIPNNDDDVMERMQNDIKTQYEAAGTSAHIKAWSYD